MYPSRTLSAMSGAFFLASNAFAGPGTADASVGPYLVPASGVLTVYSATEQHADSDVTFRYPHTDYRIYTRDGRLFKQVRNALTETDDTPEPVTLPPGAYTVVARSETAGLVSIPVVIQSRRRTVLHLEREKDWKPDLSNVPESHLVRLPNGQVIGFRAQERGVRCSLGAAGSNRPESRRQRD